MLRVRGAQQTRVYRVRGSEADELHRLRANGTLERPGGARRLQALIADREPDDGADSSGSLVGGDVHFDMVAENELRQYMSNRLAERKAGREADSSSARVSQAGERPDDAGPV